MRNEWGQGTLTRCKSVDESEETSVSTGAHPGVLFKFSIKEALFFFLRYKSCRRVISSLYIRSVIKTTNVKYAIYLKSDLLYIEVSFY